MSKSREAKDRRNAIMREKRALAAKNKPQRAVTKITMKSNPKVVLKNKGRMSFVSEVPMTKSQQYAMLAEAFANTAALQVEERA